MKNDGYKFPLPEKKLIKRFSAPFKKLTKGYSATIVTLPHTGRTSHLRSVSSSPETLKKLGIKDEIFVFLDMDHTVTSYQTFLSEMIRTLCQQSKMELADTARSAILSADTYLLSAELMNITKEITKTNKIIIALTIKKKTLKYFQDIDSIIVHLQKNTDAHPISVLWNIDTYVLREHETGHPSSTLMHDLFFQKTFDYEETIHSVTRSAISKGKKLPNIFIKNIMDTTGGFAAFSHQLTNHLSGNVTPEEMVEKITSSKYSQRVIKDLQTELYHDKQLFRKLSTEDAINFMEKCTPSERSYSNIKLRGRPTTQDILLIKLFKENIDTPVSRDDIAKTIWGKSWEQKYSDWAIDKAIQRLRKKISSPGYKLITIKNLGYQLIKL